MQCNSNLQSESDEEAARVVVAKDGNSLKLTLARTKQTSCSAAYTQSRFGLEVSERSERALMKTRILAMNNMKPANCLQMATSTTKLAHSIRLAPSSLGIGVGRQKSAYSAALLGELHC